MTKHIRKLGFTLIELLVVIAIIALLLSVIIPALGKAKIYAQKVMCSSNLKQQCLGTILYSEENDSYVPTCGQGPWLWDISIFATNELARYAGFDDNEVFFCPTNKIKKATDARFWQFSWLVSGGGTYPQEVPLRDESGLTITQQKTYYRVPPRLYLFDKYDSDGKSILGKYLETGEEANWIRKLSNVRASGSKTMAMDCVISNNNDWKFFGITSGGIGALSGGILTDDSNHKSSKTIGTGLAQGPKPDGGNIGFADGHVNWRPFDEMKHRYTVGQWFWW
ncbi:MAG: type II secretion system protein [Anaerohalosphaeraceae bacterium]